MGAGPERLCNCNWQPWVVTAMATAEMEAMNSRYRNRLGGGETMRKINVRSC